MNKKLLKLLYKSFDFKLSKKEQNLLDKNLTESEKIKNEKNTISQMRKSIAGCIETSFKPNFIENVMYKIKNIKAEEKSKYLFFECLVYNFKRIAAVALIICIILFSVIIIKQEKNPLLNLLIRSEVSFESFLELTTTIDRG
ncbi:MAG: hypothetical protein KAT05_00355 [Spirochaetes bacterium]|nr:hypothetical protein [Spirochaetota bacterium]